MVDKNVIRVKDIIREFMKLDPNAIVLQSCDPEGNGFSPVGTMEMGHCQPFEPGGMITMGQEVRVGNIEPNPDNVVADLVLQEELLPKNSPKCVILYPSAS